MSKGHIARRVVVACAAILLVWFGSAAPLPAQSAESNQFYFVQITDTHFGGADHELRTRAAVEAINSLPMEIACVVHTGDITSEKLEEPGVVTNGIVLLADLNVPVHYIPGNHDILRKRHGVTMSAYTRHFGELISLAEYHGVVFLFVYTEPLARSFTVPDYRPLRELEARLEEAEGKPMIVFHHTPSVEDFYVNRMHQGWNREAREAWVGLLNRYGVKAVIAGHFHRDEHHLLGEVPLYVSASVAGFWGRQATYRIYEYRSGRISYRTQYID